MKITTTLTHRHGKSVKYSKLDDLTVDFNSTGEAEVDENVVSALLEADDSLSVVDGVKDAPKSSKAAPDQSQTNDDADTDLSKLSKNDLQKIAKEADLPSKEWATLNKEDLIKYLEEKTKA